MTKITLATLHQATAQEVADQIVNHLLDQGEKSAVYDQHGDLVSCMYRYNGLQCAAGCLIGDEEYNEEFERKNWNYLISSFSISDTHYEMIGQFQDVHDIKPVNLWEEEIKRVLSRYGLKFNRRVSIDVASPVEEV